jgi:alcohol dehydrogenase
MMRALVLTQYGGAEKAEIREVPVPEPKPHEIRVRVRAAGLNPVDYKFREGKLRAIQRPELPIVLGSEFSGVVEALGEGVTRFSVGDRVFARVAKETYGAFAEYVCQDERLVARMPETCDFPAAAGVPLAGLTALQCLRDELQVGRGTRLFISGGAGGVGTFAIQLAKWLGAHVTTTASPRGAELVRRLGADRIIDYTQERFQDVLHDLDGALDLIGGETLEHCFEVVKPGGMVVSIAGLPEPQTAWKDLQAGWKLASLFWVASLSLRMRARAHGVRYRYKFMHPSGEELAELARLIDRGELEVVVDRVFPFQESDAAFRYLEQGRAKGKVIVTMDEA